MSDEFAFKWRVLEPWHEPDGLSLFSRAGNIFTWKDMLEHHPSSPLSRYIGQVRGWGFNAMALYADPEENLEAMRSFAEYLKENGIGMIIRREWCETESGRSWPPPMSDGRPRSSRKVCPYSEEVKAYWKKRVARDFEKMPDLLGYRMNGTEFYWINGAPWMCDCPTCTGKTGRVRVRDAIRLVAKLLKEYGGTLFWEMCQDDPWGQRHEAQYFRDLTGEIPENAFALLKRYYWDFRPGYPPHPLYDTITRDAEGRSPYVTSIQEPGEYRGVHSFPWYMVDEWSEALRDMVETGQQGLWVMAIVHPDGWDHPLNMVNWHAISRYMREPLADPHEITLSWARESYGDGAAPVVAAVLERVTEAGKGMYLFDTLWTSNHSSFPTLEYLDAHLCGPDRQMRRMAGMMGMAWPLDMYTPERAEEFRADPKMRLLFNQVPITHRLKAEAMAQKEGAVRSMEEAVALWKSLKGKVNEGVFDKILAGLEGNLSDAVVFRYGMELYMDLKLGELTEAEIDGALEACRGLKGVVVPEPLEIPEETKSGPGIQQPVSLASFAEQLRRELREPWLERFHQEQPLGLSSRKRAGSDPRA